MATAPEASELLWRWRSCATRERRHAESCAPAARAGGGIAQADSGHRVDGSDARVGADGRPRPARRTDDDAEESVELPGYELLGELGRAAWRRLPGQADESRSTRAVK